METVVCIPFNNGALSYAGQYLLKQNITAAPLPGADVTHLLLPVPSFDADGRIRGGGSIEGLLRQLPSDVTVLGGNLQHPALRDYQTIDLLQDPFYVAENAAITAHCALKYLLSALPVTLAGQQVLVIGWGRIGKCMARLLRGLDARVTVCARKESDRAMAAALEYGVTGPDPDVSQFRVLINTAPAQVVSESSMARCRPDAVKLDLASIQGLPGRDVILARGLPGKDTPESSGKLIADTVIRLLSRKEDPS